MGASFFHGKKEMTRDLTTGSPTKVLWQFSLPLLGSVLFQQMYNLADSLVAGKLISEDALSAVGNAYEVTLIYLAFAFGCNIGCSVVLSQLFGAKKIADLKTAVTTNFIFSGALTLVLMALGFCFAPALLELIQVPEALRAQTLTYLNIYTGGLIFLFFYNISNGIFTALGDSKTPFLFLAASSTANVFVDILFVKVFPHWGIGAVAWATFLCQGVSCVLAVLTVLRKLRLLQSEAKPRLFDTAILWRIIRIALPSTLQQSFISIGNIVIQSVINGLGGPVIAGYSAAVKINNFAVTSFTTLGNGISNYTAQNLGAGQKERVRKGTRAGLLMMILIAVSFSAVYVLLREQLVGLFMKEQGTAALGIGCRYLLIIAPFYAVICIKICCDGVLRGAGAMRYFMITTFTDLVLRAALAVVLAPVWGSDGVWFAWPVGWVIATVMSTVFYLSGVWKRSHV